MLKKKDKLPIGGFPYTKQAAFRGGFVSIKAAPNKDNKTRVGVVVGKKINKTAVGRNAIRRLVYNQTKKLINKNSGHDLLIVINKPIMKLDSNTKDALRAEIIKGVNKIQ